MMTIFHGENTVASRIALTDFLAKIKGEVLNLDGVKVELTEIKQALEAKSLFGQEKMVVLENFLTKVKGRKKEEIVAYLTKIPKEANLILWEQKEVERKWLTLFSGAKISLFRFEPVLFRFLESLAPQKTKIMIDLLRQTLKNEEPEIVFYMLVRQLRMLLAIKDDGHRSGIEELKRLADWQKKRLENQAKAFAMDELIKIYSQLLVIDVAQKTGRTPFDLQKDLELFLTTL